VSTTAPTLECAACGAGVAGAKYCPDCGTPVTDVHQGPPATDARDSSELDSPIEQPAGQGKSWALVALMLVAVISLSVGALGMLFAVRADNRAQDLSARMTRVAARVDRQSAEVQQQSEDIKAAQVQLDSTANTESLKGVNDQLTSLASTMAGYKNCLPELQTELDSLSIDYNINYNDGSNTYFNIDNRSQVSHDCSRLLYAR
jgi:hypothetical protein